MTTPQGITTVLPEYEAVTEAAPIRIHELQCHPATKAGVMLSISVQVQLTGQEWVLQYTLLGDMSSLRIPPPSPSGPADGLWQHTCFEAFVAADGAQAYREFNFSPSGQWAVYSFQAERVRDVLEDTTRPLLQVSRSANRLELIARWPATGLPSRASHRVGLCAVIEEADGRLSYWAIAHPKGRPDFHHHEGRALRLSFP
jgi:hypothetical protein